MSSLTRRLVPALLLLLSGCTTLSPAPERPRTATVDDGPIVRRSSQSRDAREISRSAGAPGGVVVLWPRISPRADDPATRELAAQLQARLAEVARKAASGRPVDVRPEPERVCPRTGCVGVSVGVLFTRNGEGCAATALVSGSGTSPARILPWAGQFKLKSEVAPFREPPDSQVGVLEYVSCAALIDSLGAREGELVDYIQGLLPGG